MMWGVAGRPAAIAMDADEVTDKISELEHELEKQKAIQGCSALGTQPSMIVFSSGACLIFMIPVDYS